MIKLSNKQSWAGFALVCAAFLCWKTVFVPISGVSFSQSMNPTIQVGDFGLINQFAYGDTANDVLKNIRRGDVISFTHLTDGQEHGVAKRVIGLPNDNIQLRKGALYLNGVKITKGIIDTRDDMLILKEQIGDVSYYVQYNMRLKEGNSNGLRNGEWTVPEGKLFVVGDNRDHSLDSRSHRFGYAEIAKVRGRFETIMWNTNELSSFRLNRISCPLYETKDYFPNDLSCVSRQSRVHNTDSLLAILSAGLK